MKVFSEFYGSVIRLQVKFTNMHKHLEQALAFCVRLPVPNWLKQIKIDDARLIKDGIYLWFMHVIIIHSNM